MAKAKVTEKNIQLILQGSMGKAILALAVPVVINSFLQTMYNLTDTYWLGQLGTNELAAINLVSPLQQIVVNFGSGLTVAGAVLIAQLIGAAKKEEAASMASQIFVCAMIFSIICAGVIAIFTPTVVNWLGADEPTAKVANVYLRLVILDMPFLYMVNIFAAIRQAQGDTVSPMFLNLTGILLNVVLDPLLMIVIHWGAAGAALATVIAKAVPAMISLVILKRDTTGVRIRLKGFRFEKSKMKSILTVGLPTAIGGSTMQLGFLLMSRNVYVYVPGSSPREYRLIAKFRVEPDSEVPAIDAGSLALNPGDTVAVEVKKSLARHLAGREFTVSFPQSDHTYTIQASKHNDWHEFTVPAEEQEDPV